MESWNNGRGDGFQHSSIPIFQFTYTRTPINPPMHFMAVRLIWTPTILESCYLMVSFVMATTQTFCFEPFLNRKIHYDVSHEGLTYRPYNSEKLSIKWEDIDYLKNSSNNCVDVYFNGRKDPIPIHYGTADFDVLLKMICQRLAAIHTEIFQSHGFKASTSYLIHIVFGLVLFLVIILFSVTYDSKVLLIISALFILLGIHLMNRPLSIFLSEHNFFIRSFLFGKIFKYTDIQELDFKLIGTDYSTSLAIHIQLTNGRKLKIQRFNHLILCFILLTLAKDREGGRYSNG